MNFNIFIRIMNISFFQIMNFNIFVRTMNICQLSFYFTIASKIGRASCRERGVDLGGRRIIKKKKKKKRKSTMEKRKRRKIDAADETQNHVSVYRACIRGVHKSRLGYTYRMYVTYKSTHTHHDH